MFKILVPLIAVAAIALFIVFKSVFLPGKPAANLQTQNSTNSTASSVPLTQAPSSETALPAASASPSFPPKNVTSVDDSRIRTIETAIIDLRSQIAALKDTASPSPSSTTSTSTTASTTTKSPEYIPVGAGEAQMSGNNWTTIPGYEVTIDSSNYSGYKSAVLEASIRLNQPGGSIQARLYNSTDGSNVSSSDLSVTTTEYSLGTSGSFSLASGSKTYKLQLNSTNGTTSFVQSARIKVSF